MNRYTPSDACVDAPESAARPPLQVEFQNSLLDTFLFSIYSQARSPVMLAVLFGGSGFLGYTAWSAVDAPTKPFAIFLFAMVVHLVALVLIMLLMTFVWMLVHRDRTYWHRRTLELTDQAVIESTALTRYEVQWPAVHKVHRTSWCLYVKPTAQTAHCVPRRAFADRLSREGRSTLEASAPR